MFPTSLFWPLQITLTAPAVAAVAYFVWRGFPYFQKLFGAERRTKTARELAWARSGTSSFAIFVFIALSLMSFGQVYSMASRMQAYPADSYDYLAYIIGIVVSGGILGFALYLAERRTFLRQRDA